MAFKVLPDGSIETSDIEEAVALSRRMQGLPQGGPIQPPQRKSTNSNGGGTPISPMTAARAMEITTGIPDWVLPSAMTMLTMIQIEHPTPVVSETMMAGLGIVDPKAFGGRSASINKLIEKVGLDVGDVYDSKKTSTGRIWTAGPKLQEALARLQSVKAAQN